MGAPSLGTQNAAYLPEQMEAFASGRRANDINMRMRSIVSQLTEEERDTRWRNRTVRVWSRVIRRPEGDGNLESPTGLRATFV
jgi:hypothetical protein